MDHITNSFFQATGWNRDNSYSELNATTNGKWLPRLFLGRPTLGDPVLTHLLCL